MFEELEKSINCLATEVHEKTWDDIFTKFQNLKAEIEKKEKIMDEKVIELFRFSFKQGFESAISVLNNVKDSILENNEDVLLEKLKERQNGLLYKS